MFSKTLFWKITSIVLSIVLLFTTVFPFLLPKRDIYPREEGYSRIMTFNIRNGEREERIKVVPQVIGQYYPDSIGLQEVTFKWMLSIIPMLPEYEFIGVGRKSGDRSTDCGELTPVLFLKDKYNLIDSGTFWLSETPDQVSKGWDAASNRIVTWVVLERKADGYRYVHINTHLDNKGVEARIHSVEMINEFAKKFDLPVVVTGDMNLREGTDNYKSITSDGLFDTKYLALNSMSSFTSHGYHPETITHNLPIDYVLVNSKITDVKTYKVITEKIDNKFLSDHYPVCVDMVI